MQLAFPSKLRGFSMGKTSILIIELNEFGGFSSKPCLIFGGLVSFDPSHWDPPTNVVSTADHDLRLYKIEGKMVIRHGFQLGSPKSSD